jgi:hypothetical protein
MIKKWHFYSTLLLTIAFLSSGFKPFNLDSNSWFLTDETDGSHYLFPSQKQEDYAKLNIPFTGNFFIGYKEAIAFKESQGKYNKINSLGYLGKYQFGSRTLRTIGVYNTTTFLNTPELQEKAFLALLAKNKWLLREEIEKYEGTIMNGIYITESGILAAAHLGGPSSVKRYFRANGERYFRDAYGTSIRSYMKAFGGYDTSFIEANNEATVTKL